MTKFKLKFSETFSKDLEKNIRYIVNKLKNPIVAERLNQNIRIAINRRLENLIGYEPYRSKKKRENTYYRIYVRNYIIFYTVQDNEMIVRRMLFNKRNIKNML